MNNTFALILILLLVSCSSSPILYPNKKYKTVGKDQAQRDIKKCREAAEKFLKSSKGKQIAKSAGAGAAMSAAGGFMAGLIFGGSISDATDSAVKSAAVGGAVGAAGGAISPDELKQRYVNQCLAEQGYQVMGWD